MAYANYILSTPGVAGYWVLSDQSGVTAADLTGNGSTGTYTASPALNQPGPVVSESLPAVQFDGSTQYVSFNLTSALNVVDVFSVECWLRRLRSAFGANETAVMIDGSGTPGWQLYFPGGSDLMTLRKNVTIDLVNSTVPIINDGFFHHVVATKNGATLKMYIDGVDRTGTVSNSAFAGTTAIHAGIGAFVDGGGAGIPSNQMNAVISQVAYYTTALTGDIVAAHYRAGLSAGINTHPMPKGS